MRDANILQPAKRVSDSRITLSQVIFPRDTNELGLATAGVILKTIDVAASLTAGKHSGQKNVTASLDRMDFINPAKLWELVTTHCCITRVWTTSMEVQVVVEAENTRTGDHRRVAIGYLVFVAVDSETFKPIAVPPIIWETPEEIQHAQEADIRRQNRLEEQKRLGQRENVLIDELEQTESVMRTMTPDDSNIHHNVFGGVILELIHQAGEKVAFRYANGPVIAVRQDRMSFDRPAYIGEDVKAQAIITRTWHTSMEVQVDVTARDHKTNERRLVASSYLVFVAQDLEGKPKSIPVFEPQTPKQRQRWQEADIRRHVRLSERMHSPPHS